MTDHGQDMYNLCARLYPIHRSLTGNGFRQSLGILREHVPDIRVREVPTGTRCFDWEIPQEWNISGGYLRGPDGDVVCSFADHNLHIMAYSEPVNMSISFDELQPHLFSLPDKPEAIPYVTSYYGRNWGFCIPHEQRMKLKRGHYFASIDSHFKNGSMTYGILFIPGERKEEILLSTYLCHPQMANNELSGPAVAVELAKWMLGRNNKYGIRLLIIPETIGSIYYLSQHLAFLKKRVIAGFMLNCMGDDKAWSFLPSRHGFTLADRAALHVLHKMGYNYTYYPFIHRGSDERQYCAPGVDLPVASVMRSKYHEYYEYHTHLDDMSFISAKGLGESLEVMKRIIETVEMVEPVQARQYCEPKLDKYNLMSRVGGQRMETGTILDVLAYADGRDALDLADTIDKPLWELGGIMDKLKECKLI